MNKEEKQLTDKQIKNRKYYKEHKEQICAIKRKQYRKKIMKKYEIKNN